jgi:coenzyme PQQ synthesis protein D (PqqD)
MRPEIFGALVGNLASHEEDLTESYELARRAVLRAAAHTSFALMDGRPILFSEKNQKIYELNQISALIWCKLLDQTSLESIYRELVEFGIERQNARSSVRQALQQWLDLELVEMEWKPKSGPALQTNLAQRKVRIGAANEELMKRLESLFCVFGRGTDQTDIAIEILQLDGQMLFRNNRGGITRCQINGLAPAIKADLTERIILRDQPDFALHAASLTLKEKGLILCGQPGIGKSTLALHLIDGGFRYCGDDIVLISPDGLAQGLPFAPTVKPGAWEAISRIRNDLEHAVVHDRADGMRVRYLPLTDVVHEGSFAAAWIIFLNRIGGAGADLTQLNQIETMGRVIGGSFAANGRLSQKAFAALKKILAEAKSFELTYGDALQAARKLTGLCHGSS